MAQTKNAAPGTAEPPTTRAACAGAIVRPCILVVEDEYIIAVEMAQALEDLGAEVIGPAPDVAHALQLVRMSERLDGAVLDINLRGETVFPVAQALRARGISFVFATGYSRHAMPDAYTDVPRFEKPVNSAALARLLVIPLRAHAGEPR